MRALLPLLGLAGLLTIGQAAAPPRPETLHHAASLATRVEAVVAPLPGNLVAPGVSVAVRRAGEDTVVVHAGRAALAPSDRLVDDDTLFPIGSISKPLTTALISRLVDAGKLRWDDPIEAYVPEFQHRGRGITLRRIAGHLSGLGDKTNARLYTTDRYFPTTDDALAEILKEPLATEPGSGFAYATSSFTLLAAALERADGRPFAEAMRARVLAPLGLEHTRPNVRDQEIPGRALGYERDPGGGFRPAPYADPSFKLAGAGYLSNARDLARFGAAVLEGDFLSESARAALLTSQMTSDGTPTGWGLGYLLGRDAQGWERAITPGGGPGITTRLVLYPKEGLAVVLLTNMTNAAIDEAVESVAAIALEPEGNLKH